MGFKHLALLALGVVQGTTVLANSSESAKRQSTTAKYCPGDTQICFSEFQEPTSDVIYRIAIPDVSSAPFDVLLQIVAPIAKAGWAGIAWGGAMKNNPLTVAWPNGAGAVVSSRWSTGRTVPGAYAGATYSVLPTTTTNATHWQLDVLCTGCSQWEGGALDPNGLNNLAWAKNTKAVNTPSSNTSSFGIHDGRGVFSHDLSIAKIPQGIFDALVYGVNNPDPSASSTDAAIRTDVDTASPSPTVKPTRSVIATRLTELPPIVTTRVTELPKPTSTRSFIVITVTQPLPTPVPTTTVTATAWPPVSTQDGQWPPWVGGGGGGGGGPPWGWGKGKGKGKGGRWGRQVAAPPAE